MIGTKPFLTDQEVVEVRLLLLEVRGEYERRAQENILPDGYREYCNEKIAKINRLLEKLY